MSKITKLRLALLQLAVSQDKQANILKACQLISKAAQDGAQLVCLPECFNSPYGNQFFPDYAESIPGETTKALAEAAKTNKVYLLGGTIPESDNGKLYNTATAYDPNGNMLMKYRKNHLFDVDIPNKITFKESETLTAGNRLGSFVTPYGKVGVGICYDLRFPILAHVYAHQENCDFLIYPGAFSKTTGELHWEILSRARAVDNQVFVACISPAREEGASFVAYGHSLAVDPWGKVLAQADHTEDLLLVDLNLEESNLIREQIPIKKQRRDDLYKVVSLLPKQTTV